MPTRPSAFVAARSLGLVALALAASLAVLPASARAAERYKPQGRPVPYEGFHAKFPSGLQLIVYEMPSVDRFAVTVSYASGEADDPAGKEGLAHLCEHLAFRAQPAWSGGKTIWDLLTRGGYRFNAFTDQDRTDFWVKGKPGELRTALLLEAARLRDPLAGVTEDDFAVERDVVVSEYRERFETDQKAAEAGWVMEEVFKGHPFGRPHQNPETLRKITLADAAAWTKQHYRPENAVMVVISPRKSREVVALVADLLGEQAVPADGTKREPLVKPAPPLPAPTAEGKIVKHTAPVRHPVVWVAWPVPGSAAKQDPQAQAVADAVQNRVASAISDAYRGLAVDAVTSISGGYWPWQGAGMVWVRVELGRGGDVDKVVEAIKSAAATVRTGNSTLDARTTRDNLLMQSYLSLEDIDGSDVASFLRATGQADYLDGWQKLVAVQLRTDAVTYASQFLKRERSTTVVIQPDQNELARDLVKGPERGERVDQAGEVSAAGTDVAPPPPGLAAAERRVFANGLEVVVIQRGKLPIADLRLLVRTKPSGTPGAPAGIADMALGSNFESFSLRDLWLVSGEERTRTNPEEVVHVLRGSSANLDVLLETMGHWAGDQQARYFDQVKFAWHGVFESLDREPFYRASQLMYAGLFPAHPYGQLATGASVKSIRSGQADDWLSDEIRPERATLVVVSDQAPTPELWLAIERHLGGWKKGKAPRVAAAPPALPEARKVILLDRPGASQAVLYLGVRAPARKERDDAALAALRWTLEDRINTRLRVEEGVSYGFHLAVQDQVAASALVTAVAVDRDAAAQSLGTVLDTVRTLSQKPLAADRLAAARLVVAREYAYQFDTVRGAADALEDAARHGLPPDHHDRLAASIASLTPERVQAVAASLAVGKEVVVVMGDAATLRPQLEKAGFAVELAPAPAK